MLPNGEPSTLALHTTCAPGVDGEASSEQIMESVSNEEKMGRYLGWSELDTAAYELFATKMGLDESRTPSIIAAAAKAPATQTTIQIVRPHLAKFTTDGKAPSPFIPRDWLRLAFTFHLHGSNANTYQTALYEKSRLFAAQWLAKEIESGTLPLTTVLLYF